MQIAFKVDVDTKRGLEEGVPNLLKIFKDSGRIPASFFIPMGPDRTGRTITRVFKNPKILEKVKRTNIFKIYGFPTLLYGTILPAPNVISGNEELVLRIRGEGHEVGIHGYDHFKWQDYVEKMNEQSIIEELGFAVEAFRKILNSKPIGFAAPGWQGGEKAQKAIDNIGFLYTSNTRGRSVYFPKFYGWISKILEIPTTMPTMDELYLPRRKEEIENVIEIYLSRINNSGLNVCTIHAEIEGICCQDFLMKFIETMDKIGCSFARLDDIANTVRKRQTVIETSAVIKGKIKGRAGLLLCQSL